MSVRMSQCPCTLLAQAPDPSTPESLPLLALPDLLSNCKHGIMFQATTFLHCVSPDSTPCHALSHGPTGDAAVGGVTLSPSTMAVAQGPSLAAASGTTVPGKTYSLHDRKSKPVLPGLLYGIDVL